tara:strand:- start:280 stop:681 length:402 start_codon:yes stop_codon:yes gene_type:complete
LSNKLFVTWKQIENAVDKLAVKYEAKYNNCTSIYGLPRGGLPLAVMLSHRLNLPLTLVEPWTDPNRFEQKGNVLIVDDIADTGAQLSKYENFQRSVIFTIFYHKQSVIIPDEWIYEKHNQWIVYPWEVSNEDN